MRHALASVCAFASNVLLAVGFALALLSHFLESERSVTMSDKDRLQQSQDAEDRVTQRRDVLIATTVAVGLLCAVLFAAWWKFSKPAPEPPAAVTAPASACTVTVNNQRGTVTLRPGDNMTLEARCAPDVQVVDLIASVPPPGGVVGAERIESTGNGVYGGDTYPIPAEAVDVTVTFWVWADGKPADSVTVQVVR